MNEHDGQLCYAVIRNDKKYLSRITNLSKSIWVSDLIEAELYSDYNIAQDLAETYEAMVVVLYLSVVSNPLSD